MNYQSAFDSERAKKLMTREQYDQVIEAILAGKYSWACLLTLRFAGDNPLHYMPYRTFNRLMKENRNGCKPSGHRSENREETWSNTESLQTSLKIKELDHLNSVERQSAKVKGGTSSFWTI